MFVLNMLQWVSCFTGHAIKCWVCRSDSDPKCADPFDNSTVPITDCKQEPELEHLPGVKPTMCRKIRQKGIMWEEICTSISYSFSSLTRQHSLYISGVSLIYVVNFNSGRFK